MNWVDGGLEIETTIICFWSPMSDQDRETVFANTIFINIGERNGFIECVVCLIVSMSIFCFNHICLLVTVSIYHFPLCSLREQGNVSVLVSSSNRSKTFLRLTAHCAPSSTSCKCTKMCQTILSQFCPLRYLFVPHSQHCSPSQCHNLKKLVE